ncbi:MAG: lysine--tRNA ligase [Sphingomonadales bacterium]
MISEADIARDSKAWPFVEAKKLLERQERRASKDGPVLFETGYGPSGLPHIGTFGEVARTSMVRFAYEALTGKPTRLVCFSDDMDGLRKVPDNIPNRDAMAEHLDKPLTQVPDPFGTHQSFGHHNNARLKAFLDEFGFDYEFLSSTECYQAGMFDAALIKVLENYDAVMGVILPTLGAERRATYSPFLPVCPKTGRVLQVPVVERKPDAGTIVYRDVDDTLVEAPVTGGHCKLQWKADWAMRWAAFGVDYEMSGKDLIESVNISSRLCKILGATPPAGFNYELFLDEKGEKISKSKGNGLTIEEWLRYGPAESLSLYMFQSPRKAKRLYFDVIPRAVDDYITFLHKFASQTPQEQLTNPVWHIHGGKPAAEQAPLTFALLLNLVGTCHSEDKDVLWGFIHRYAPGTTPENQPLLDRLVGYAVAYYRDFVRPNKKYRLPCDRERGALERMAEVLEALPEDAAAGAIQAEIYEIGKTHGFENLRDWFKTLYETLLGQSQGPRMGSFVALYGKTETIDLIRRVLGGEDLGADE